MRARARLRAVRKVALAAAAAGVLSATVGVGTAGAATSSTLLYSTDGGASWSSSATVAPGGTVLVRQWYDNDGSAAETGASLSTTIPDGFTLNGGSTQVCSNPSTTNPTSPNSSELECAASNEGSVWSGSDLQVSPTAGLFGQSNGLTSGILEMGKKRYINLHECTYNSVATPLEFFIHNADAGNAAFRAGTNASNSADGAVSCGSGIAGTWNNQAVGSSVQAIDLLDATRGHGYVEYALTAPPGPTPEACAANPSAGSEAFAQDGSLTSTPSGAKASSGTITVDWTLLSEPPCPEDPIPLVDPMVAGAGLVAVAGAGFVLYRRRDTAVA